MIIFGSAPLRDIKRTIPGLGVLIGLSFSVCAPGQLTPAPELRPHPALAREMRILILEGRGAVNDVSRPAVAGPTVEVRDENYVPVEGAEVEFQLPESGPGGMFANQQRQLKTRTNSQGQAFAPFIPNKETGRFEIKVTARSGDRVAEVSIPQSNSTKPRTGETAGPHRPWYRNWKYWAIAGGATAGIVLAVTYGGGSSSPTTIILTPGTPVVTGPR